jgi:hypothetical protein
MKLHIRSIGLWRWYTCINITVTNTSDIIQRPIFYLKHMMDNDRTSQETRYVYAHNPVD